MVPWVCGGIHRLVTITGNFDSGVIIAASVDNSGDRTRDSVACANALIAIVMMNDCLTSEAAYICL